MTRSRERGRNEITDEALEQSARTGQDVCAVLSRMLSAARRARDKQRQKRIEMAQKFLGCRNRRKRRSR
jgi:hypothetical protein